VSINYSSENVTKLAKYYKWHARAYDITRWAFLFGRKNIVAELGRCAHPDSLLEIGCGTGKTLKQCQQQLPNTRLYGVDLSLNMLDIAQRKLSGGSRECELMHGHYSPDTLSGEKVDVILFSYCLSMINPGYTQVLDQAYEDLKPGGLVAVVDFHHSGFSWFRNWMQVNHVRMEKHLLPELNSKYQALVNEVRPAYLGLWHYFTFIGRK
jgi:S-adenosylmethionine-diacylgycerolhomoserine-N-methlytransferase